ncbi:MAG TPA: ABC transporter substrate-binding protein [Candidatus Limnocylindrales bacterium]|nr:ABC transporter substrate-binding protein [Candidatus Limnocylindrales bacterium]
MTFARNADVISWDPIIPTDNPSIWAQLNIYDQLVRVAKDAQSVEPDLATAWDISPDGKTYTFHLRPGVTFSDGTPVKASDVQFSLDRVATDKESLWGFLFPKMDITAPDDATVVITLDAPWAPLLADLSVFAASIIPQAYFEQVGEQAFGDKPIGSGPFVLADWQKGSVAVLKRNPTYWDQPKPYLDEVDLKVVAEDNTRMLQVQSGQLDIATDVPFNQIDALKKSADLDVQISPVIGTYWIQFNQKLPQFQDMHVRQAINWAVDKEALIKSVLFGYGEPAYGYLGKMLYSDLQDAPYGYDVAKAKDLMSQSKYPNGFAVTLLTAAGDTIGQQVAVIVKAQLAEIGITVNIQQEEAASAFQKQVDGDYEMIEYYMTSDIIDPAENTTYAAAGDGGSNAVYTYYNNPMVNDLVRASNTEMDATKREADYLKIQQLVHEDAPMLFLFWQPARTAVRQDIHGFQVLPTANYRLWEVWKS